MFLLQALRSSISRDDIHHSSSGNQSDDDFDTTRSARTPQSEPLPSSAQSDRTGFYGTAEGSYFHPSPPRLMQTKSQSALKSGIPITFKDNSSNDYCSLSTKREVCYQQPPIQNEHRGAKTTRTSPKGTVKFAAPEEESRSPTQPKLRPNKSMPMFLNHTWPHQENAIQQNREQNVGFHPQHINRTGVLERAGYPSLHPANQSLMSPTPCGNRVKGPHEQDTEGLSTTPLDSILEGEMSSPTSPLHIRPIVQTDGGIEMSNHKMVRAAETSSASTTAPGSERLSHDGSTEDHQSTTLSVPTSPRTAVSIRDFVPLRVIGKGSYGKVFLVRCKLDNHHYAMKMLRKDVVVRRRQVDHTMVERRILEAANHPFIVKFFYAFQTMKRLYMVVEYCPGGELFFHLSNVGRFSENKTRFYASQIILAIQQLHERQAIYRDLKPENVVIDEDGYIRLTDFGLAKDHVTRDDKARSLCGTPEYLAPEVLLQKGHGFEVDWWALGALIYEMFTGLPPFYSQNREQLLNNIKKGVITYPAYISANAKNLLTSLFLRDPKQRLGSGPRGGYAIMAHPWFAHVDWEALKRKQISAPFKPDVRSVMDLHNFDKEFLQLPVKIGDEEGGDAPSVEDDQFPNFAYDYRFAASSSRR